MNYTDESYLENILIRRVNIRKQLDYQVTETNPKEINMQPLEYVGRCPSIRIKSPENLYDVDQLVQKYRFALQ